MACRPLPGPFPRPRPARPASRWLRRALEDLVARVAAATRLLHGLERARHGLLDAVAGARASPRLPAVAELVLTAPAIAAPTVVRHVSRLGRRGGPLGRVTPAVIEARKTAVSRTSDGEMLRHFAASGWLVELTGSRTHRAYVPRDLAELGIDVQPARLRLGPGGTSGRRGPRSLPCPRRLSARRHWRWISAGCCRISGWWRAESTRFWRSGGSRRGERRRRVEGLGV